MKKIFFFLFLCVTSHVFAAGLGASLTLRAGPTGSVWQVEQRIGASLVIANYSGSSITINQIFPYAYVTKGAMGSLVSWSPPVFDLTARTTWPGQPATSLMFQGNGGNVVPPNTPLNGGSVWFQIPAVFHRPSISPQYVSGSSFGPNNGSSVGPGGSIVLIGVQTFSLGASVYGTDGSVASDVDRNIEIDPLPLPASEISGNIIW